LGLGIDYGRRREFISAGILERIEGKTPDLRWPLVLGIFQRERALLVAFIVERRQDG
jgi:hypothetical protein